MITYILLKVILMITYILLKVILFSLKLYFNNTKNIEKLIAAIRNCTTYVTQHKQRLTQNSRHIITTKQKIFIGKYVPYNKQKTQSCLCVF